MPDVIRLPKHFAGIHARLLALVFLAAAPLVVLTFFGARRQALREHAEAHQRALTRARFTAAHLDFAIAELDALLIAASRMAVVNFPDALRMNGVLDNLAVALPGYCRDLTFHHPTEPVRADPSAPQLVADLAWLRNPASRRTLVFDPPKRVGNDGEWVVTLNRAVFDATDHPVGIVSVDLELAKLAPLLDASDLPPQSLICAYSFSALNVARSREPDKIGTPAADRPVVEAAIAAREGSVEFKASNGTPRLAGYATCQRAPWLVFVRVRVEPAFAAAEHDLRINSLAMGGALIASVMVAWLLGNRFVRPIRELAGQVNAFGKGTQIPAATARASGEIGALARAFGEMASEISARDRELRDSEQRYRTLVERLPDAIIVHQSMKIVFANSAAVSLLGARSEEQLIGADFASRLHPDDQPLAPTTGDLDQPSAVKPGSSPTEVRFLRLDGTAVETECQYISILYNGKPGIQLIARDITLRKQTEAALSQSDERFREFVDGTNAVLWEADAATQALQSISANVERVLGYARSAWLTPGFWASHVHPEDVEQIQAQRQKGIRELRAFASEYRFVKQNGRVVWLRDDVKIVPEHGAARWLRGLTIDISETRELEIQLRQAQKLKAIGTLAGGIAHDFNNILLGIYGYTELARGAAPDNSELQEYLGEITAASRRAADLVRQILAFSRVQYADLNLASVQLGDIVVETVKLLRATSPSSIEIVQQMDPDLPLVVGNPSQFHQVTMNLGTNALHAMEERGGRLTFRLEAFAVEEGLAKKLPGLKPGSYVKLTVSDTGKGMDAETQQRVFEPFFTTKGPHEGTGLGLSVVHGIVSGLHGAIRLTSEVGRGTTFEIFLPVSPSQPSAVPPEVPAAPRGHGERILFVDDEEPITKCAQPMLRTLGYVAECENDVLRALARLESDPHAFDLVVSDQTMPGMSGLEFAERIRALQPNLPVVLASGYSALLSLERIRAAGVREVLAKPYTMEALAVALRRHLSSVPSEKSASVTLA